MLIWNQGEGTGGRGKRGDRRREREGGQTQENRRGEGLDIHFRMPPLGICFLTPDPLCDVTLWNLTKADNYAFSTMSLSCI